LETAASVTPLYDRVPFRATAIQVVVCALAALTIAQAAGQPAMGRIEGKVTLVLPPAGAVPSGVYPSRRVNRPLPSAPTGPR